jgi:hypothetical protein
MTGHRLLLVLAGAVYATSWCVPVAEVSGDLFRGTVWGWKAFLFAVSPALGNDMDAGLLVNAWMVASALSNLLVPAVVACETWPTARRRRGLAWALGAAVAVNLVWWLWPDVRPELRVGYFLWVSSFAVGAIASIRRVRRDLSLPAPGAAGA